MYFCRCRELGTACSNHDVWAMENRAHSPKTALDDGQCTECTVALVQNRQPCCRFPAYLCWLSITSGANRSHPHHKKGLRITRPSRREREQGFQDISARMSDRWRTIKKRQLPMARTQRTCHLKSIQRKFRWTTICCSNTHNLDKVPEASLGTNGCGSNTGSES